MHGTETVRGTALERTAAAAVRMPLAQDGANVALTCVTSKEKDESLAGEAAAKLGVRPVALQADVSAEAYGCFFNLGAKRRPIH